FRRGLSPAVSRQESIRLLRARRHRRVLSCRYRSKADAKRASLSSTRVGTLPRACFAFPVFSQPDRRRSVRYFFMCFARNSCVRFHERSVASLGKLGGS